MSTTVQQRLDDRYGRTMSRRARRLWWIAVGVVAVTVLALLSWSTVSQALRAVDHTTTGFVVDDEHRVEITAQVTPPRGSAFACAFEAQDVEHGVVGWRVVEYPASDETFTHVVTERVPTTAEATTGLATACWTL